MDGLFKSKEERARIFEEYSKKIFPRGDEQRQWVSEQLSEMFPNEKSRFLMMHYIMIKELMVGDQKLDFETAAKKIEKKKLIRITPELREGIQKIMEQDLK